MSRGKASAGAPAISVGSRRMRLFQVPFHGRGGQGVVTAAELLSVAAFVEGRYAQAFPSFGSERAGAPVVAFCRLSDTEIRTRSPISEPDALVIADPTLLHQVDLFRGLRPDGYLLVNTKRTFEELGLQNLVARMRPSRLATVAATDLALAHVGRPAPNVALLGGLAALTGEVSLDSVLAATKDRFSATVAEGNGAAAAAAFDLVLAAREGVGAGASPD